MTTTAVCRLITGEDYENKVCICHTMGLNGYHQALGHLQETSEWKPSFLAIIVLLIILLILQSRSSDFHEKPQENVTHGEISRSVSDPSVSDVTEQRHRLEVAPVRRKIPDFYLAFDDANVSSTAKLTNEDCIETFLARYFAFCERALLPAGWTDRAWTNNNNNNNRTGKLQLCPCIPVDRLIGRRTLLAMSGVFPGSGGAGPVRSGGHWSPADCVPRQRVAVIIPFRDREWHLVQLLHQLHPFLQRQLTDYTIYVVEQDKPRRIFNKASIMNAGFLEVTSLATYDCIVFHDVDMLPEDDRNFYTCTAHKPLHNGAYVDKFQYRLLYPGMFGGVTSFRPDVFITLNGFSNEIYGWGAEDDEMYHRIAALNMSFVRFPRCVARYTMIRHTPDERNPPNYIRGNVLSKKTRKMFRADGLNNVRHTLQAAERRPLYTWLLVSVPPPPSPRYRLTKRRPASSRAPGPRITTARQRSVLNSTQITTAAQNRTRS